MVVDDRFVAHRHLVGGQSYFPLRPELSDLAGKEKERPDRSYRAFLFSRLSKAYRGLCHGTGWHLIRRVENHICQPTLKVGVVAELLEQFGVVGHLHRYSGWCWRLSMQACSPAGSLYALGQI